MSRSAMLITTGLILIFVVAILAYSCGPSRDDGDYRQYEETTQYDELPASGGIDLKKL